MSHRAQLKGLTMGSLAQTDKEMAAILAREAGRQRLTLNLIASENYASRAVLEAQGSIFTNKYAEGYPGRRYYAGCEVVDEAETLAIRRAKELFQAEHANVQPHSGAQANMAAYFALLQPGDTVLAMRLTHGGHLTHGAPINFSGQLYRFVSYGVNRETERIDFDEIEKLARECRPKLIVAGASAYPRRIDFLPFRRICDQVGAYLMADIAHLAGLVAGGVHPSPVPCAHVVTSTSHKTLRGPRGGFILCPQEQAAAIDAAVFPGIQGGPLVHSIAAKAVALWEAQQPAFVAYQQVVIANAQALAQELQALGFRLVSGGTDNHLLLMNLAPLGLTGREAESALAQVGIIVNRNAIPFDTYPPNIAGGIRLGTPAVTTRGMGQDEMSYIARLIHRVLTRPGDGSLREQVHQQVRELCQRFPIPGQEE